MDKSNRLLHVLQFVGRPRYRTIEILAQGIQRVPPGVPFIRYELLKNTNGGGFSLLGTVLDSSCDRWSMRKPDPFGQKGADLQVGIDARLRFPEELQDELVSKN